MTADGVAASADVAAERALLRGRVDADGAGQVQRERLARAPAPGTCDIVDVTVLRRAVAGAAGPALTSGCNG